MKTRNILIICMAFLVSMPCADAQSFKDGLKSIGDKIGKQIVKTDPVCQEPDDRQQADHQQADHTEICRKQDVRQGQSSSETVRCNDGKCS